MIVKDLHPVREQTRSNKRIRLSMVHKGHGRSYIARLLPVLYLGTKLICLGSDRAERLRGRSQAGDYKRESCQT
jgi:hypothetical protein